MKTIILPRFILILLVSILFLGSCVVGDAESTLTIDAAEFDFGESDHGWQYGFADYPAAEDSTEYELTYEYTDQPSALNRRAVLLSGKNLNRDLFMYLKKKISGLRPSTEYVITFNVELTSDLSTPAAGSMYLKAGAYHKEPKTLIEGRSFVLNLDKGNQGVPGENMLLLGSLESQSNSSGYTLVTKNNTMANSRYIAKSDVNGDLWLIIGTDSDRDGVNAIYYSKIGVILSASR